jgi:RNA polymerase sigma factor (sigma-70 family)
MESQETRVAQVFLAHHGFVKGLALKHAPWPGLADDILQQVFVEFMAKAGRWDLETDLKPLLATMTRHVALRHWRERTREMPEVMRQLADHVRRLAEERSEPPGYDHEDEVTTLRRCLDRLPDASRSLIDMYYYGDVTTTEIAARTGARADTVCRAICRLREKLRACMERASRGGEAYV